MNYKYINNNYNMERIGTCCKVMHGKALQTTGGLTKKDLKYNKNGEIVSKKVMKEKEKSNLLMLLNFQRRCQSPLGKKQSIYQINK